MASCVEVARRLSRPSVVLDKRDVERLARCCEAERTFLRCRFERFLRDRANSPVLMTYSSDVTPLLTVERYAHAHDDECVVRKGRCSHEFLIQRCFAADLDGGTACLFEKPLCMAKKTAFAHFAAYRQFCKTPSEYGAHSLNVVAHIYDRAIQSPVARLHRQWQHLRDSKLADEEQDEGASYKRWLHTWFVSVGCAAHDCHGGLKWSILSYFNDKQVLKSAFIVVESLRNGYSLIVKHLAPWISRVLHFEDWHFPDCRQLYMALDVDPGLLDDLEDLELRFSQGCLRVAVRHRGENV